MWVQIVGKVRMALTPPLNHWWHAPLYVSARGLTTSAIPYGDSDFEVEFDFVEHRLTVLDAQPGGFVMDLRPRSVAEFYREFMAGLRGRGIEVRIHPKPSEVADAIPFAEDEEHASYDPVHAAMFWRGLSRPIDCSNAFGADSSASRARSTSGGAVSTWRRPDSRAAPRRGIRAELRTARTG